MKVLDNGLHGSVFISGRLSAEMFIHLKDLLGGSLLEAQAAEGRRGGGLRGGTTGEGTSTLLAMFIESSALVPLLGQYSVGKGFHIFIFVGTESHLLWSDVKVRDVDWSGGQFHEMLVTNLFGDGGVS